MRPVSDLENQLDATDWQDRGGRSQCSTQLLSYRIAPRIPSAVFDKQKSLARFARKLTLVLDKWLQLKSVIQRLLGWGCPFACRDVVLPRGSILGGCWKLFGQPCVEFIGIGRRFFGTLNQFSHKRTAPPATCSRTLALRQLARQSHAMDAYVIDHFPPTDVKAKAKFIVRLHRVAH